MTRLFPPDVELGGKYGEVEELVFVVCVMCNQFFF